MLYVWWFARAYCLAPAEPSQLLKIWIDRLGKLDSECSQFLQVWVCLFVFVTLGAFSQVCCTATRGVLTLMECLKIDRVVRSCNVILSVFLQVQVQASKCAINHIYKMWPLRLNVPFSSKCGPLSNSILDFEKVENNYQFNFFVNLSFIMSDWFGVKFTLMVLSPSQMLVYIINRTQCGYVSKPFVLMGLWLVIFCNTCT